MISLLQIITTLEDKLAMTGHKLTPMQEKVFNALREEFEPPARIASRAKIHTVSPQETASHYCIQLVRLGLAEKGGRPKYPRWRRKP